MVVDPGQYRRQQHKIPEYFVITMYTRHEFFCFKKLHTKTQKEENRQIGKNRIGMIGQINRVGPEKLETYTSNGKLQ